MLEKYLQEIGLSEKESQIYLALLQVDSESIQDIAKKTGINRTTVYPVLESLNQKGLVSEVQDGKKTMYQAAPPERLETFVERQKVILSEHASRLKDVIPQIKSIQRATGERPIVKLFEGRDGAISAMEEFFGIDETGGEAYFFYSKDLLDKNFTQEEKDKYLNMRLSKKITSESIYTYANGSLESNNTANRLQIDSGKYPITCDIAVYKDIVRITTLGESISSILVKSKDLSETLISLFRLVKDSKEK